MIFYATIDTNVLLSGLLKLKSIPGTVVLESLFGKIIPVLDKEGTIIEEYFDVLSRSEVDLDSRVVEEVIIDLERRALLKEAKKVTQKIESEGRIRNYYYFPDETDIKFYAVTLEAVSKYNTRLVTGNINHFPKRKFIKTPREMLQLIKSDSPERNLELLRKAYTNNFFKKHWDLELHTKLENMAQPLTAKRKKQKDETTDNDLYYEK